ncbi:MAG TPA: polyribonucleotide nucleotidyltransferase [Thermoanaerobaculia bacterium]|nr:polyribonucleotide nucleotidyltransferase [Thermoanaerobaculia bacterium]
MIEQRELQLGDGTLVLETGRVARQADGACVARFGDTVVLATACMAKGDGPPRDFLPLTVDYREYTYAAGRIPGGFFKREGRPTEKEITTSRLIDRPLRPLFPEGYFNETQIIAFVLSADGENDPDILALNAASTALTLSEIPFYNPIGAVRLGMIDGALVVNPTSSQRDVSDLDLVVAATRDAVVMVEAAANQLSEGVMLDAIFRAHEEIRRIIDTQIDMFHALGLRKPEWQVAEPWPRELYEQVKSDLYEPIRQAVTTPGKHGRRAAVKALIDPYVERIPEEEEERRTQVKKAAKSLEELILRDTVLGERRRFDGRALDAIRPIDIQVGLLPRTHGSALFTRGETQALVSATLGTSRDAQIIEEYEGESRQKFLLHYNFPPFSVGEVKFLRGSSRREIGHGVLARRALTPLLPHDEEFAYTVRVVSDILESNGSSSMATVCGGSLALFDAGVPMLAPVAGVAMGLIKRDEQFAVLSDIAGAEDHYGDMDFKIAGTRDGITALQMDIKITGIDRAIMEQALAQARDGRLFILEKMEAAIAVPRGELSQYAPRLHVIEIPVDKIRDVIGPGGKTIRSIVDETGCEIEVESDGVVKIFAPHGAAADRAKEIIERLTEVPEVGRNYTGKVRRIENFGAFVEILPNLDGLLHISELAPYRVGEVRDILSEGDEITVKVLDYDEGSGKVRLSRKAVIMEAPDYDPAQYEGMGEPVGAGRGREGDGERGGDRGGRGGWRGGDRGGRGGDRGGRGRR